MSSTAEHKLPDVLSHDLCVIFCGTAAGAYSARVGAYYAHPQNKFWRTLYQVGLTPRLLAPHEFPLLPQYGIGLTDIAKTYSGADKGLRRAHFDPAALRHKIELYAPRVLAFDSKNAARGFYGAAKGKALAYEQQPDKIGATVVFVLPSTSGAASGFWDVSHWQALADFVRQRCD
jgi:TDG/mug DNA glycosylase family protein